MRQADRQGIEIFVITQVETTVDNLIFKFIAMYLVGNVVADITKKISELRGKRAQNASTFQLVVVILHVLSLSIFGLMNKLTELFNDLSEGDLSNAAFELSPIDPVLMSMLMPVLLIMTSIIRIEKKLGKSTLIGIKFLKFFFYNSY